MPNFPAFLSYVLITSFTPGPNNLMSMSNAGRYGLKKSLPFNLGVFCGFFIILMICSVFSFSLYSLIPAIKAVMTYIGSIYILYLAWKTYTSQPPNDSEGENEKAHTNTFASGLLLQFVNPKVIIYGITTVSTFIMPYYKTVLSLTLFSVLLALIGFIATFCWSLFGSVFRRFLITNNKKANGIMALLLVYCAVSILIE